MKPNGIIIIRKTAFTALLLFGLLFGVYSQQMGERKPFSAETEEKVFNSTLPSESNQDLPVTSGSSGQLRAAPPGFEGDALGIVPVRDVFWLFPVLGMCYAFSKGVRRRITPKSPEGDFEE